MDEYGDFKEDDSPAQAEAPVEQGETAEIPATVMATGGEMEIILLVLTSVFLLIAILLGGSNLYSTYGIGKNPVELKKEKAQILKSSN